MCLAIPGKVVKVESRKIEVKYPNGESGHVLIGDEPVKEGGFVLVQMGTVVKILSEKEAAIAIKSWKNKTLSSHN